MAFLIVRNLTGYPHILQFELKNIENNAIILKL